MSAEEASRIARAVQRVKNAKRGLQIALPTAAALGAGAAVAVGSIPGGDGTITGCYANEKGAKGEPVTLTVSGVTEAPGALRVIDPSQTAPAAGVPNVSGECQPGEATLSWNQKGPQGPPGVAGPQGPAGAAGGVGETTFGLNNTAGKTFLKLDGIKGESTDKKHKDTIEVSSFSWGVSNPSSVGSGGGGGAGKTVIQSFSITKTIDKASPLLLKSVSQGTHIKVGELMFARKAGGKQLDYLYIKMQDVLISSVKDGVSSKGTPQETVSFAFQKAQEVFLGANGKPQATVNLNFASAKV